MFDSGQRERRGGEWMIGLGLGFTNPVGTGRVLDVTCLCVVVGPGFVSVSPAFMRSSASHSAGPHGRLVLDTSLMCSTLSNALLKYALLKSK